MIATTIRLSQLMGCMEFHVVFLIAIDLRDLGLVSLVQFFSDWDCNLFSLIMAA